MGILRKGFKISKSSSLVMIQEAFVARASSRNLSSLGSRQAVMELGIKAALIKTLVSKTKKSVILRQNFLKNFFCKSPFFKGFTYFVKKFFKIIRRVLQEFFIKSNVHSLGNSLSFFRGRQTPFFSNIVSHFNNYSFHDINNLKPLINTTNSVGNYSEATIKKFKNSMNSKTSRFFETYEVLFQKSNNQLKTIKC